MLVSVTDVRVGHQVKLADFTKWLERQGGTPREITQRLRIRSILGSGRSRRRFQQEGQEERLRSRDSGVCAKNPIESGEGGRHLIPPCGLERIPTPTVQNRRRYFPPRKRAALAKHVSGNSFLALFRAACIVSLSASVPPPFHLRSISCPFR